MIPLKEAIKEKHTQAERMPFNIRMMSGGIDGVEYLTYLYQQFSIFNTIERYTLPHQALYRGPSVLFDIQSLYGGGNLDMVILKNTKEYTDYLETLSEEETLPHIYLNYLALAFGGQMVKERVPGAGKMYEFEGDMKEIIGTIRAVQRDEWADEVNKGLDYIINIFEDLWNYFDLTNKTLKK